MQKVGRDWRVIDSQESGDTARALIRSQKLSGTKTTMPDVTMMDKGLWPTLSGFPDLNMTDESEAVEEDYREVVARRYKTVTGEVSSFSLALSSILSLSHRLPPAHLRTRARRPRATRRCRR